MSIIGKIDALEAKSAPAPWAAGTDPCHFDAPEVRSAKWAIYVPTDADAELIAALRNNWPAIRKVLVAARSSIWDGALRGHPPLYEALKELDVALVACRP